MLFVWSWKTVSIWYINIQKVLWDFQVCVWCSSIFVSSFIVFIWQHIFAFQIIHLSHQVPQDILNFMSITFLVPRTNYSDQFSSLIGRTNRWIKLLGRYHYYSFPTKYINDLKQIITKVKVSKTTHFWGGYFVVAILYVLKSCAFVWLDTFLRSTTPDSSTTTTTIRTSKNKKEFSSKAKFITSNFIFVCSSSYY